MPFSIGGQNIVLGDKICTIVYTERKKDLQKACSDEHVLPVGFCKETRATGRILNLEIAKGKRF